ncbi:MAG: ComF family protein [Prevotellaceae bacterium]|jgi:ComF family protein|nr:ComF family protein [Prevotellaceae bacterium]
MLQRIWDGLTGLVFPDFCEVCGTPLVRGERYICMSCLYKMPRTRFWEKEDNEIAKLFWGKVNIERACSLFYFRKGSDYRPMIHKLKYKGKYNIGLRLGEELGVCLDKASLYSDISMLVPVPLHPAKERMRGYNQSEYIAYGLSNIMNLPVEKRNLIRTKYTQTQTRKSSTERWENVREVFDVRDKSRLNGEHILLIDDVITTGATIESCASTILNNCQCKVSIASIGYTSGI